MKAQDEPIRVRIPPSPTGAPHLGTAYMAVFNYIFARKHGGKLILRFEDTDLRRLDPRAEEMFLQSLEWLGIQWDEGIGRGGAFGPYRSSQRLEIYQEVAKELLRSGWAYRKAGAIFLAVPNEGQVGFKDLIRGEIVVQKAAIKDLVLIKRDQFPTYNFAVTVDDIRMQVSHVIRGEDHISNTPKQILIYQALGARLPHFAHFPLLRGRRREKLSKRHGALSILEYRQEGYLPEALINYLILLGWTHPQEKEVFPLSEAIKYFNLEEMHKTAPMFDAQKLKWLNGQWIKGLDSKVLEQRLRQFYPQANWGAAQLGRVIPLVQERMRTLAEFASLTSYFFVDSVQVDSELLANYIPNQEVRVEFLSAVREGLARINERDWQIAELENRLRRIQDKYALSPKAAFMTLRVVLTGRTATPGLFETIVVLGKERTLRRLDSVLGYFTNAHFEKPN